MFAARYFSPRYWANRFWPPTGSGSTAGLWTAVTSAVSIWAGIAPASPTESTTTYPGYLELIGGGYLELISGDPLELVAGGGTEVVTLSIWTETEQVTTTWT